MDATLIVIDSDEELARACAMVDGLMKSADPLDIARLAAQARLIASYEAEHWPPPSPAPADVVHYLMDQFRLSEEDLIPLLGPRARVVEILRGERQLTLANVQRLRQRFGVPADLLLPPLGTSSGRRPSGKRVA